MTSITNLDHECGFDISPRLLKDIPGEIIYQMIGNVLDVKGQGNKKGNLILSNLRVIWYENGNLAYNLSIGLANLINITTKEDVGAGNTSVYNIKIRCSVRDTKYQFLFSCDSESKNPFKYFQYIFKAYEDSKPYRDVLIRTNIISLGNLLLLDQEKILREHNGIFYVAKDEGKSGRFYFTNIRVIWVCTLNEHFNISVPYYVIQSISSKTIKIGTAIKITTTKSSGGFSLGFKCESPKEKVDELNRLHSTFSNSPYLGLPKDLLEFQEKMDAAEVFDRKKYESQFVDAEIMESAFNENQQISRFRQNYDVTTTTDNPIELNNEIGVAMEVLPPGMTADMLWQLLKMGKDII